MKIRDIIITGVNGDDHYIKDSQTTYSENFQKTVFKTIHGEEITMKVEFSKIVAGSYQGDA